ncbi:MAG: creatininase family protein [Clostridiales bacterium]|nr:creatininase family protein [Clostridiales bacterium]
MTERRDAMPVAYIGLGILEWHGLQNPLGLDAIKSHGIACHLAEKFGGVVMPPMYWGDHRSDIAELDFDGSFPIPFAEPENDFDHTVPICEHYGVEKERLVKDGEHSGSYGGWEFWEKLLVRAMFQTEAMGFKSIVLIPGHFHQIDASKRAIERYNGEGGKCRTLVLSEFAFENVGKDLVGDHAASFETSLMLALCPELVDISELDANMAVPNIGVIGLDPRKHASKEVGEKILAKFAETAEAFILQK